MDFIKGYKKLEYSALRKQLCNRFDVAGKTFPELAVDAEVTSTATIKLVFDVDDQKVSDKVLTSVCRSLNFSAFVIWLNGERSYFVKSKN